jgi:methionine--tRNA ligase beta chain
LWIKAHYLPLISFSQALSEEEIKDAQGAASKKKESYEEAQLRKKEKKAKEIAASKKGQQASPDSNQPEFTKIEIRVGKIIKVWYHETADKLFCEQVDLGEETGPREIASGLREHYTLEEMQDREVLVVCNLKAAKIVGFVSNGMVLAAKVRRGYFVGVESAEEPRLICPIVHFFREKTGRRSNLSHLLQVLRSEKEYLSRG